MEEPEKQDENETFDFYSELGNMEDIDLVSFAYQITSGMVNKIITFLAASQYYCINGPSIIVPIHLLTLCQTVNAPVYHCINVSITLSSIQCTSYQCTSVPMNQLPINQCTNKPFINVPNY